MTDAPYKTAKEAYQAVHDVLSWAVESAIENGEYKEALVYCALMREIEGHTDIDQAPEIRTMDSV